MQESVHPWNIWIMAAGPSQCQTFGGTNDKAGVAWNSTTLREKVAPAFVHQISLELQTDSASFHSCQLWFWVSISGCLIWRIYFFRMAGFHSVYFCVEYLAIWCNLLRPSLLYQRSVKRRVQRLGTDGVRYMVFANNWGTSWVLNSVGLWKSDKRRCIRWLRWACEERFLSCHGSVTQSEGRFDFFEPNTHETLFLEYTVGDWKWKSCLSLMTPSIVQEGQR